MSASPSRHGPTQARTPEGPASRRSLTRPGQASDLRTPGLLSGLCLPALAPYGPQSLSGGHGGHRGHGGPAVYSLLLCSPVAIIPVHGEPRFSSLASPDVPWPSSARPWAAPQEPQWVPAGTRRPLLFGDRQDSPCGQPSIVGLSPSIGPVWGTGGFSSLESRALTSATNGLHLSEPRAPFELRALEPRKAAALARADRVSQRAKGFSCLGWGAGQPAAAG